jgi:hypothetical protein
MQQRLVRARRSAAPVLEIADVPSRKSHSVILGLGPSLRGTGYGVIRIAKSVHQTLEHGTVFCPATWERSRCFLAKLPRHCGMSWRVITRRFARGRAVLRAEPEFVLAGFAL